MAEKAKRSLAELQSKARAVFDHAWPSLVWIARDASTPTAAYDMAHGDWEPSQARACRYLTMIKRDYGEAAFEQTIFEATVADDGTCDLTTDKGVLAFGRLNAADKQRVWDAWLTTASASNIIAFLDELYENVDSGFSGCEYSRWGYEPFDREAYRLVLERDPSDQDLLDLLVVGMKADGNSPLDFLGDIGLLRKRRPAVELCVEAIVEGTIFAQTAWELIQEYDIPADQLRGVLGLIVAELRDDDPIKTEAQALLDQVAPIATR